MWVITIVTRGSVDRRCWRRRPRCGIDGAQPVRSTRREESTVQNPVAQTSATDFVRSFAELSHSDVDYAGGKGANLGELTGAGIPVPAGFVVGAPAYAAFCDDGGLRSRVADALASVDVDDPADLDRPSGEVRKMVEARALPRGRRAGDPRRLRRARRRRGRRAGRGALLGHGRGHRVGLLRGDERDLPQRARSRGPGRGRAAVLVLAVREPHPLLPGEAGLRPGRHGHRGRRPAPDPVDPLRRDVHHRSRQRRPSTGW